MPRSGDFSLGLVSGIAGGLAAAFVMSEFQALWMEYDTEAKEKAAQSKPATLKAADKASTALAGAPVPAPAQKAASSGVHYLTGAVLGGLYGAAAAFFPGVTAGAGLVYGGAAWAVMDEAVVPTFGLGPKPTETAPKEHLYGLASHLVFGLVLELTRAAFEDALAPAER